MGAQKFLGNHIVLETKFSPYIMEKAQILKT